MGRKRTGLPAGRPVRFSSEVIAEIYACGVSAAEVARLLGMHHTTVAYRLNQMGITTSPKGTETEPIFILKAKSKAARVAVKATEEQLEELLLRLDSVETQLEEATARKRMAADLTDVAMASGEEEARAIRQRLRERLEARKAVRRAAKEEREKERQAAEDARVAAMMAIINRRPVRLSP